ncbi:MAG: XrtA/PEP-CTERM system exopolysaccharide export protein [Wenzhouxiangella sp.]|jgi:polysaccharide export outer membrane protein|nr:XrtA/PEP-CTERM system exopolysaccharide export protein [Wenzhouxiangella sp.]
MLQNFHPRGLIGLWSIALVALFLVGCQTTPDLPEAPRLAAGEGVPDYIIGAGDSLNIRVWRQADLSATVPVRPDGRITTPLVEDMMAAGKTPAELARDMETALSEYVREPVVTVLVNSIAMTLNRQIRVIGQAANPQAIEYRSNMTVLDVMIAVGGLTEFAAGNRATILRTIDGETRQFSVRLDDLVNRGDVSANVQMLPGDVLVIPETRF